MAIAFEELYDGAGSGSLLDLSHLIHTSLSIVASRLWSCEGITINSAGCCKAEVEEAFYMIGWATLPNT